MRLMTAAAAIATVLLAMMAGQSSAFCPLVPCNVMPISGSPCRTAPALRLAMTEGDREIAQGRRRFLGRFAAVAIAGASLAVQEEVVAQGMDAGPQVDWYRPPSVTDGNYTGLEWQGPVWKKPEGEPSISYAQFLTALKAGELAFVDFVGYSGEKVYARYKATPNERIRVGEGLPDETTPPPKPAMCVECEESCKPEDKTCSCLSSCGGRKDWNSPIYLAKVVKRFRTPFRYSQDDNDAFGSVLNRARRFMMFDGPMSAGLI